MNRNFLQGHRQLVCGCTIFKTWNKKKTRQKHTSCWWLICFHGTGAAETIDDVFLPEVCVCLLIFHHFGSLAFMWLLRSHMTSGKWWGQREEASRMWGETSTYLRWGLLSTLNCFWDYDDDSLLLMTENCHKYSGLNPKRSMVLTPVSVLFSPQVITGL